MTTFQSPFRILNPRAEKRLVMMRINLKIALLLITSAIFVISVMLWSKCGTITGTTKIREEVEEDQFPKEIECDINGEYTISCMKDKKEIYIPFSFIHHYFEIYGKLAKYDDLERFEWSHSYSKVYIPKTKYNPRGVFLFFENYNVETRDRVKLISGLDNVPISTQWESTGYFYPTQIAQFALSHYSKNLTEPEPRRNFFKKLNCYMSCNVTTKLNLLDFVLSFDIIGTNLTLTVLLEQRVTYDIFKLHYVSNNQLIVINNQEITYGIGINRKWRKITRDLFIDLQKGLNYKLTRSKIKVIGIELLGSGSVENVSISTTEHMQQFYDGANWFVNNQNKLTGGWLNPVKRKIAPGFKELPSGWYSAMGQGHAISVLTRAYYHSNNPLYLNAAKEGLRLFRIPTSQNGVLTTFLDKYIWYEEYPTQPSSFVLNGFIYALLGLYDLQTLVPEAGPLFKEGFDSLKSMLMLFDTGSGTTYDLRHITLGCAPNLARWDYHATHVNQLLVLATLDSDSILQKTAERWLSYMQGKRANHN